MYLVNHYHILDQQTQLLNKETRGTFLFYSLDQITLLST